MTADEKKRQKEKRSEKGKNTTAEQKKHLAEKERGRRNKMTVGQKKRRTEKRRETTEMTKNKMAQEEQESVAEGERNRFYIQYILLSIILCKYNFLQLLTSCNSISSLNWYSLNC